MAGEEPGDWGKMANQLAKRFEVAAQFGYSATHNAPGSAAIAAVIKEMGRKLDIAVARELADNPSEQTKQQAQVASAP